MNIGIDIDETISNTHEILFSYAQKYTVEDLGRSIKEPKEGVMTGNGYCQAFHEWTVEEANNFWDKYYEIVLKEVTVRKFAKETIQKLRNQGHKIYLVTARFPRSCFDIRQVTEQWLNINGIEYDAIIYNAQDKVDAVKLNKIEVFIDDAIINCKHVSEAGVKTYMIDSIENQGCNLPNVTRIYSWVHAEQEINKL